MALQILQMFKIAYETFEMSFFMLFGRDREESFCSAYRLQGVATSSLAATTRSLARWAAAKGAS